MQMEDYSAENMENSQPFFFLHFKGRMLHEAIKVKLRKVLLLWAGTCIRRLPEAPANLYYLPDLFLNNSSVTIC